MALRKDSFNLHGHSLNAAINKDIHLFSFLCLLNGWHLPFNYSISLNPQKENAIALHFA